MLNSSKTFCTSRSHISAAQMTHLWIGTFVSMSKQMQTNPAYWQQETGMLDALGQCNTFNTSRLNKKEQWSAVADLDVFFANASELNYTTTTAVCACGFADGLPGGVSGGRSRRWRPAGLTRGRIGIRAASGERSYRSGAGFAYRTPTGTIQGGV